MALSKSDKDEILKGYLETLQNVEGMVVTEYRGMNMKKLNTIRGALRPINGGYIVTKNTLFKIALHETGFAVPEDLLTGPVAVAFATADLPNVTKAIMQRAKEDELLILKGAIMGKTVFSAQQLEALSTMPTLDQARASLIGTLQTPASQFVGLINQPAQGLAGLLLAYSDKQNETAA